MSFIRKIHKNGKVYLAEVENRWVAGRCVQKHLRYVGREANGQTILAASLSNVQVDEIKLYGPLLVLDTLAKEIDLLSLLGPAGPEILALVYAHCLDYKSINQMERWFSRTELPLLLPLAQVTERSLLEGLDALEQHDSQALQQRIFHRVVDTYRLSISSIIYDVTNTYFYGKRCPLGKYGHDKDGVKGRPLIQIGLAVAKNSGIPIAHQVFPGNIHDAKMFQDFVTTLRHCRIAKGLIVYDRGIASAQNLKSINELHWQTLCGLPIRGQLAHKVRAVAARQAFIQLANRVRVNKTVFYARLQPYALAEVPGTLAICFNEQMRRDLRESRYDEILHAQELLRRRQTIKAGLEKYFGRGQVLRQERVREAEQFDGYTCLFATGPLRQDEMLRIYFDKDLVEKAFQTLKGVARLQPIRHWLYNRVTAHVFICYLAYLLLALLQYRLRPLAITATEALTELETMYKVYLRDAQKGFQISRVVTLTKKQELILRTIDRKLLKPSV